MTSRVLSWIYRWKHRKVPKIRIVSSGGLWFETNVGTISEIPATREAVIRFFGVDESAEIVIERDSYGRHNLVEGWPRHSVALRVGGVDWLLGSASGLLAKDRPKAP